MNAESVKRFEVTFIEDIQGGETAEHVVSANRVEIVDGNLCFYEITPGRFFNKRKLVAAYAAGVWVTFLEYEDEEKDEMEWQPPMVEIDQAAWEQALKEARITAERLYGSQGKDGSIGG